MHNFNENWDGVRRGQRQVNEMLEWWNIALFSVIGLLAAYRASEAVYMTAIDRMPQGMKERIASIGRRHAAGKAVTGKERDDAIDALRKGVDGVKGVSFVERKRALEGLARVRNK